MPCLIVTGYPCSGKTTVSQKLKERALQHPSIDNVMLIDEETACPDRTRQQCYETSLAEKQTRAALKTSFDRTAGSANSRTLVILDSLNYIKGVRYEMHCISKAAGTRHGVLWVLNQAMETWNRARPESEQYSAALLQELVKRYEPPDERNRWDKPLYTIDLNNNSNTDSRQQAVTNSVYNMHALGEALSGSTITTMNTATVTGTKTPGRNGAPSKKSAFSRVKRTAASPTAVSKPSLSDKNVLPESSSTADAGNATESVVQSETAMETAMMSIEERLDVILDQFLLHSQPLKQGTSTRSQIAGNSNVLQSMDSLSQRLITAIAQAQTLHTGGAGQLQIVLSPQTTVSMQCSRVIGLPELRRLRKQYLQWAGTHPPEDTSEHGIANAVVRYIEDQV